MEITSAAWKENQSKQLTNEAFVEISYALSDPLLNVSDTTASEILQHPPIANLSQISDEVERKIEPYATLEKNLWLLDGSKITLPTEGDYGDSAYISQNLSQNMGYFGENPPTVEIAFDSKIPLLPGLTITWGVAHGDYPIAFDIVTYDEFGEELARKSVTDNRDVTSIVPFEMRDFCKVKLEIHRWCEEKRRARISKIFEGIQKVYTKEKLLKFTASQSIDPLSASLPKYEMAFEIDNTNEDYDPTNEAGLSKYMMERQEIRTRYGFRTEDGEIEWISGGIYFLSDWEAPQNGLSASFKARDLLGFLNGIYYKGRYNPAGTSLYDLAEDVLTEAKLPELKTGASRWKIDPSLREITTQSPLPVTSFAECLQLIANAAGASIFFDRSGTLFLRPLSDFSEKTDFSIHEDNSYTKAEVSLTKPLKAIDVSRYGWQLEAEEKELYHAELSLEPGQNTFVIEYSDAATEVHLAEDFGGWISADLYTKSGKLEIFRGETDPATCQILMLGRVIKSTETIVSVENSNSGEVVPLKNVLITDMSHAKSLGRRLCERYNKRKNLSTQWRLDPALDAGDFVKISRGDSEQKVRIFNTSFDFTGAFKGKSEGVVME